MPAHKTSLDDAVAAYNQHVHEATQTTDEQLVIEYETLLSTFPQNRARVVSRLSHTAIEIIRRHRAHEFKSNRNAVGNYRYLQNRGRWRLTFQDLDVHFGVWWSKPYFLQHLRDIDQKTSKSFREAAEQINSERRKELRARHVKAALDSFLESEGATSELRGADQAIDTPLEYQQLTSEHRQRSSTPDLLFRRSGPYRRASLTRRDSDIDDFGGVPSSDPPSPRSRSRLHHSRLGDHTGLDEGDLHDFTLPSLPSSLQLDTQNQPETPQTMDQPLHQAIEDAKNNIITCRTKIGDKTKALAEARAEVGRRAQAVEEAERAVASEYRKRRMLLIDGNVLGQDEEQSLNNLQQAVLDARKLENEARDKAERLRDEANKALKSWEVIVGLVLPPFQ